MSFYAWKPYVPVAKRREKAAKTLAKMQKKGASAAPVIIQGRAIASTFWGKSWCNNLERYSDYASRLPRGRSYLRNGSVLDLQIAKGEVTAKVMGSELYNIKITIAATAAAHWTSICNDCAGSIDSVVELLQGRLAKGVMDRVCRQGDGLYPAPKEITLSCSCPDWADMCKHVAAALYGVGARLDAQPELLFALRGVDAKDMIAGASAQLAAPKRVAAKAKVLADDDMAALFGLDMAEGGTPAPAIGARADAAMSSDVFGQAKGKPKVAATKAKKQPKKQPRKLDVTSSKPPDTPTRSVKSSGRAAIKPVKKRTKKAAARRSAIRTQATRTAVV
jgi:uncharacterized Zn finger protein